MERFLEIAIGSISTRGKAIHFDALFDAMQHAQKNGLELYRSYYFFDRTLKEHLEAYKTVKGFPGSPIIDLITLDVDKGGDTDKHVHQRAIGVHQKLIEELEIDQVNIRPFYSGRGYHIVLPNLWDFKTHIELRDTLKELFPECDPIYDKARLIRVANTVNYKTGLYKIPLKVNEFLGDTEGILKLAKNPRNNFDFEPFDFEPHLRDTKITPKFVLTEQPQMVRDEGLSPIITCMQRLYNSKPQKGSRHTSMLRMVSAYKRSGIPRTGIEIMMQTWVGDTMSPGEIRKIVTDTFEKNYNYSCQDPVMEKWCDDRCIFFKKKSYNATLPKDLMSLEDEMKHRWEESKDNSIELARFLPLSQTFTIYPEEFIAIVGDTGLGKSAFVQNIMVQNPNLRSLYLNFEVGERLMYRRFLQIAHAKTKYDIIQHYADPDAPSLSTPVNHIHMVSNRINTHTLEQLIVQGQYQFVVVDTLECFITPGITDITPKTEYLAHEMKRLANRYGTIIFAAHHISKSSVQDIQGNRKNLTVHAGKGSSALEQEADKIILLEGIQEKPIRRVRSAKARDESPFDISMVFDAERTFRFYEEKIWESPDFSEGSSKINTSQSNGATRDLPALSSDGLRLLR